MKKSDQISIQQYAVDATIKVMQSLGYNYDDYKILYEVHSKLHAQWNKTWDREVGKK